MNVAIISDIHMRDGYVEEISTELERVLEKLDREYDPSSAFVLGDLIEDGESASADRENVRRVRSIFENWSVPVTYLLGNHDVERLDRSELRTLLGQERFYGVQRVDDTPFVYLDSSYRRTSGATGQVGPEQLDWLADRLRTLSDPVVLVHHPVGNFDLRRNVWFSEYPERAYLWDRKEVLDRLDDTAVRGTISGHIHQTGYDQFREIPHVSVNAFSKELPDVALTGTYAVLSLDDPAEIEIRTRSEPGVTYSL